MKTATKATYTKNTPKHT